MTEPTAVIAEDEPALRRELTDALARLWPELTVLAAAGDGLQAVEALETHRPDVLFLDIEMPGMSGLEVARVANGRCHVVFVTAYDHYAVAAFEQGALDYVLKPFNASRLAIAVARLRERIRSQPRELDDVLQRVSEAPRGTGNHLKWITVAQGQAVRLITVEEVCYFRADNKYTTVVTATTQSLISKTIRELLAELDPEVFVQIHRGTIVNLGRVLAVHRDLRGRLEVEFRERRERLPVSAAFASRFRRM